MSSSQQYDDKMLEDGRDEVEVKLGDLTSSGRTFPSDFCNDVRVRHVSESTSRWYKWVIRRPLAPQEDVQEASPMDSIMSAW